MHPLGVAHTGSSPRAAAGKQRPLGKMGAGHCGGSPEGLRAGTAQLTCFPVWGFP